MNRLSTTSFVYSLLLASMLGIGPSASSAKETPIQLIRYDDSQLWYLNKATLIRLPDHIVSFWSRIVPRKNSTPFLETQAILARAGKDPRRLEFFQRLDEVDCRNSRMRTLSIVFYDAQGRILLSRSLRRVDWTPIAPRSDDAVMREAACSDDGPAEDIMSAMVRSEAGN
jgi:Surface-adhesin protein E